MHSVCSLDKNCFFCHMRSSCLRLRREYLKGPKYIKVNEFTSQLGQFEPHWRVFANEMPRFIEKTVDLLCKGDFNIFSVVLFTLTAREQGEHYIRSFLK